MNLRVGGYSGQTIYAFNKLAKLFFEKGKPHNASLIAGIRIILITLEYDEDLPMDVITATYQIGILLKKSRLLLTEHSDQQLLKEIEKAQRDREAKKRSPSLVQLFSNIFKRRDLAASEFSSLTEVDLNMRKSRSQYQLISTSKQIFEMSSLSKHLIKNLQTIINVLTDQEENEKADTEEVPNTSSQKKPSGHSFSGGSSKPDKRKGRDTRDQSSLKKIPPVSDGEDDSDSSSSEEESDRRKLWHPKPRQKINIPTSDNVQE